MIRADLPEDLRDMPRGVLIHALDIDMTERPRPPRPSSWLPRSVLIDPWLYPDAWAVAVEAERLEQAS